MSVLEGGIFRDGIEGGGWYEEEAGVFVESGCLEDVTGFHEDGCFDDILEKR